MARRHHLAVVLFTVLAAACGRGGHASGGDSGKDPGLTGQFFLVQVGRPVGGTITSTDGKLRCGPSGSGADACGPAAYAWGDLALLQATPEPGYFFQSWAGDCSDSSCSLTTERNGADKYAVAVFATQAQLGHANFISPPLHAAAFYRFLAGVPGTPQCTSCHGFGYQGTDVTVPSCNACHAGAGWTKWQSNCSFCHGVKSAATQAWYDVSLPGNELLAAPPDDVRGRLDGTDSATSAATGAHQAHVTANALATPIACGGCHLMPVAPTGGDPDLSDLLGGRLGHVNGTADLTFGALAGGATARWNASSKATADGLPGRSCATYCHGATLGGGTLKTPSWTRLDGTARACNACHGTPPPAPHPAGTLCGACHPGYTGTSVDAATHVNGRIDAVAQACGTCHGLPPPPNAPGFASTHPASDACEKCHAGYTSSSVNDATHANGTVEVVVTGDSCNLCHGAPPPAPHPPIGECGRCHPGYTPTTVNLATHRNGTVDVIPMSCTTCHGSGDPAVLVDAAPPLGVQGESAVTQLAVGAHQAHLAGKTYGTNGSDGVRLSGPLACQSCHVVPTDPSDLSHIQGGRAAVVASAGYDPNAGGSCLNACHGSNLNGGVNKQPGWTTQLTGSACDACHGYPPSTRGHVGLAAADGSTCWRCHRGTVTPAGDIRFAADGTTLHVNRVVDEDVSTGRLDCSTCHGGLAMTANAGSYHHVMGQLADGWTTYPSNPAPTSPADKTCVSCHVDHPEFTAARGANLRASITGVGAASVDLGACASCHQNAQAKDFTGQKDDGTRQTYAIDPTAFGAGGHAYLVGGSITGTGPAYDFTVACTKCHNSTAAALYQDGKNAFGLHESTDRRLRAALGRTTVGDDVAEDFCFRCHSNAGDAVGGAKKAADLVDWYGAAAMPPGSTGVYTQMNGTPPATTTSTDTLYFKPSTQETVSGTAPAAPSAEVPSAVVTNALYLTSAAAATPPAGYLQTSATCTTAPCYDTTTLRQNAMSITSTSAATTVQASTTSGAGARYDRLAQFLSPPVASPFSWNSGAQLGLNLFRSETSTNNNCFFRYSVYKWSSGTATQIVTTANGTTEFPTTAATASQSMTTSGSATFAAGDQLLVEVEVYKNAPTNTAANGCTVVWGNQASDGSRLTLPATADGTFPSFQATAPAPGGSWSELSMSPFAPTAANQTITGTGTTSAYATQLWQRASFVSPAVVTASTLPAASWTLSVNAARGSLSSNTAYLRYHVYRWNADNTQGPDIVPWRTASTALPSSTAAVNVTTPAGAAVALGVGDKVVLDLEVETMNTTTSVASNSTITFGSANTSNVVMPAKVAFSYASPAVVPTAGHLGALYTGLHRPNPAEENLQRIAAAKHVECSDCHDPHQARRGNQADGGTATAGAAGSLTDANQSWAANAWVGYYVDVLSGTGAGGRAQITANTATQLTFAASVTPGTGSGYRVSMRENAGTVTASSSTGSSTTLTDGNTTPRAKAWQTDLFKGWFVTVILASGDTQTGVVAGNGATTITVATDASHPFPAPANGAQYVVTKLPNVLTGAGGVGASSWGATTANWTTPTYDTDQTAAIPDATTQWQVCLKCHSGANSGLLAGWQRQRPASAGPDLTDLGLDFNPNNRSNHPVAAGRPAAWPTGVTLSGSPQLATSQLINGWKPGDLMYCSDCHGNNDTSYGAAQGPHASALSFVLRGPNTLWPSKDPAGTRWTLGNSGTGLFCLNCHALTGSGVNNVHSESNHNSITCTGCHVLVPHGGRVTRLIVTPNAPTPYRDASQTPQIVTFRKATSSTGYSENGYCKTACSHHSGGTVTTNPEAWP